MRVLRSRFLGGLLITALLAGLLLAYGASQRSQFSYDVSITRRFQSWHPWGFDPTLAFFNELTNFYPGIAIWTVVLLFFLWRGLRIEAFTFLLAVVPFLGAEALGLLVGRSRPSPDLVEVSESLAGNGFPSGHVLASLVFYGLLIRVIDYHVRPVALKVPLQATAASIVLLSGLARVYRGAHWPTDVLGGALLGSVALAALLWIYARLKQGRFVFLGLDFTVAEHRD